MTIFIIRRRVNEEYIQCKARAIFPSQGIANRGDLTSKGAQNVPSANIALTMLNHQAQRQERCNLMNEVKERVLK